MKAICLPSSPVHEKRPIETIRDARSPCAEWGERFFLLALCSLRADSPPARALRHPRRHAERRHCVASHRDPNPTLRLLSDRKCHARALKCCRCGRRRNTIDISRHGRKEYDSKRLY
ncbi:hypothetical protein AAFF_G00166750 [Aldrovandia affinis]|uniref:Uncharacterized protein n=1 Tax=Aldrovandia affinis TaxID=143900 RepID=A0AAD7W750_9TELE|nr:hypothetical protein AAFF_G00166750 [Aldrovandia affinis]